MQEYKELALKHKSLSSKPEELESIKLNTVGQVLAENVSPNDYLAYLKQAKEMLDTFITLEKSRFGCLEAFKDLKTIASKLPVMDAKKAYFEIFKQGLLRDISKYQSESEMLKETIMSVKQEYLRISSLISELDTSQSLNTSKEKNDRN